VIDPVRTFTTHTPTRLWSQLPASAAGDNRQIIRYGRIFQAQNIVAQPVGTLGDSLAFRDANTRRTGRDRSFYPPDRPLDKYASLCVYM
jgi:hypothetical protein